jgi:hypothetical protein
VQLDSQAGGRATGGEIEDVGAEFSGHGEESKIVHGTHGIYGRRGIQGEFLFV